MGGGTVVCVHGLVQCMAAWCVHSGALSTCEAIMCPSLCQCNFLSLLLCEGSDKMRVGGKHF